MTSRQRPVTVAQLALTLSQRPRRTLAGTGKSAAVLVPLVGPEDALQVLLTLRTDTVPTHKGQVAFPGGGVEEEDTDVMATALRELREELGILPGAVDVLGLSDDTFSINGQRVTPVVGWLETLPDLTPSQREIADVFTVPLRELMAPQSFYDQELETPSGRIRRVPFFHGGKHTIWGLTAWILKELFTVLDGMNRGENYLDNHR